MKRNKEDLHGGIKQLATTTEQWFATTAQQQSFAEPCFPSDRHQLESAKISEKHLKSSEYFDKPRNSAGNQSTGEVLLTVKDFLFYSRNAGKGKSCIGFVLSSFIYCRLR